MRITGGIHSGRLLKVPKGLEVRPTPDLVKQAVFNSLGARVVGAEVLELFAGSGALSLECLSRGASRVICIEKAPRHARMIEENIAALGFDRAQCELRVQDVFTAVGQLHSDGQEYDLLIADPPYGEKNVGRRSTSLAQRLLDDERLPPMIRSEGLFVLGHTKRDTLSVPPVWHELKVLKHGDTLMRFFQPTKP